MLDTLKDLYRIALYIAAIGLPAVLAGYSQVDWATPDWLIFALAVVSALGGATAVGHFTPTESSIDYDEADDE